MNETKSLCSVRNSPRTAVSTEPCLLYQPLSTRGKRAAAALQEQQQFHAPGIVELCTGSASSQEAAPHHNRPVMRSGSENERFYDFTSARNHLDNGKDKKQSDGVFLRQISFSERLLRGTSEVFCFPHSRDQFHASRTPHTQGFRVML